MAVQEKPEFSPELVSVLSKIERALQPIYDAAKLAWAEDELQTRTRIAAISLETAEEWVKQYGAKFNSSIKDAQRRLKDLSLASILKEAAGSRTSSFSGLSLGKKIDFDTFSGALREAVRALEEYRFLHKKDVPYAGSSDHRPVQDSYLKIWMEVPADEAHSSYEEDESEKEYWQLRRIGDNSYFPKGNERLFAWKLIAGKSGGLKMEGDNSKTKKLIEKFRQEYITERECESKKCMDQIKAEWQILQTLISTSPEKNDILAQLKFIIALIRLHNEQFSKSITSPILLCDHGNPLYGLLKLKDTQQIEYDLSDEKHAELRFDLEEIIEENGWSYLALCAQSGRAASFIMENFTKGEYLDLE